MLGAVVGERLPPPPCHLVPVLSQLQAGSFFNPAAREGIPRSQ